MDSSCSNSRQRCCQCCGDGGACPAAASLAALPAGRSTIRSSGSFWLLGAATPLPPPLAPLRALPVPEEAEERTVSTSISGWTCSAERGSTRVSGPRFGSRPPGLSASASGTGSRRLRSGPAQGTASALVYGADSAAAEAEVFRPVGAAGGWRPSALRGRARRPAAVRGASAPGRSSSVGSWRSSCESESAGHWISVMDTSQDALNRGGELKDL
mmetsp:Transcript_58635/g.137291  ORF Transcript_58635/g.137291 Transcript_58635/m.137291 type:complete len:214 (-) Transcript_58635:4-645(-)